MSEQLTAVRTAPVSKSLSHADFVKMIRNGKGIPSISNTTSMQEGEKGRATLTGKGFSHLKGQSLGSGTTYELMLTSATIVVERSADPSRQGLTLPGEQMGFAQSDFESLENTIGLDLDDADSWGDGDFPIECKRTANGALIVTIDKAAYLTEFSEELESYTDEEEEAIEEAAGAKKGRAKKAAK